MAATAKPQAPLFTKRALFTLIWPLLLEQTLSVTMGMADTLMVSGVGEAAVSSVSLVDSLNILIIQILSALATGGAVIASQYLGRKDEENASHSAAQLYSVLGISTITVGVVCMLLSRPILRGVFGSIDDDVMRFAQQYFLISAVSYPFIGLYNGGAALFRAQGNSRISMLASLVMNIINIAGNAILIYGFRMGVIGAALATLIGRVFAAVFILCQNQNMHNPLRVQHFADLRPRREPIMKVLSIGIPSGLENGMFQIGKLCVSSLTSTLGTSAIAANAVANSVSTLANIPGATMSLAMIPVIGQCLGAGEKKQAQRYTMTLMGHNRPGAGQPGAVHPDARGRDLVQPLDRGLDDVYPCGPLVQSVQRVLLGDELYPAQRPARGRRCQVHDDGQHHQYVAVPRDFELCFRLAVPHGPDRRLVRYVHRLDLPQPVLRRAVLPWEVDGT